MSIDTSIFNEEKKRRSNLEKGFNKSMNIGAFQKSTLKLNDKQKLYKDLSVLLSAGIGFKTALDILISQQKQKFIAEILQQISNEVVKGKQFYEAIQQSGVFTPYEFYSIKIGEETKKLESVLLELHKYFLRQVKLRKQIVSVVTYPLFVLVLTFAVLYFMLAYVVPMFKSVFNQFGSDLPGLTQKIIYFSEQLPLIITGLVIAAITMFLMHHLLKSNHTYRRIRYQLIDKIPFFGRLLKVMYLARFCQFLDLLLSSKTPLTDSLDMVKLMIGYYPIENSIDTVKNQVVRGVNFADALKSFSVYEKKLTTMVEVAEHINQLDTMFSRLAEEYEEELDYKTKMLGVVLEPLIIIILGGVVGIIMVAMYAPMFDLSKLINK